MMLNIFLLLITFYGFHILREINQNPLNKEVLFDNFFDNDVVYILCTSGAIVYAAIGIFVTPFDSGTSDIKTINYTLFRSRTTNKQYLFFILRNLEENFIKYCSLY